eukprot:6460907-Amphidinium_carterae.1
MGWALALHYCQLVNEAAVARLLPNIPFISDRKPGAHIDGDSMHAAVYVDSVLLLGGNSEALRLQMEQLAPGLSEL